MSCICVLDRATKLVVSVIENSSGAACNPSGVEELGPIAMYGVSGYSEKGCCVFKIA